MIEKNLECEVEEEEVKEEPKNMVVSMNERFSRPETDIQPMYDKLHDEVLAFRASVHAIHEELRPLQEEIIAKVAQVTKKI